VNWTRLNSPKVPYENDHCCFDVILKHKELHENYYSNDSDNIVGTRDGTGRDIAWPSSEHGEILRNRRIPNGNYQVSVYLSYTNKSSAYGLEDYQPKSMRCHLTPDFHIDTCNNRKVLLLGDSHMERLHQALIRKWDFLRHGDGIYYNAVNWELYKSRKISAAFQTGKMLSGLRDGSYDNLQIQKLYDIWVFESGHADLRDVTLEVYMSRVDELFYEFAQFRARHDNITLIWAGVPAYSYNRDNFGGLERRTNIKLALADQYVKRKTLENDINYISFFEMTYFAHSKTCDKHHYMCHPHSSATGIAHANFLVDKICNM
jgi:hypothetical protein